MKITLNGAQREVPDGLTVGELLQFLNLQHQRVAVELNLEIVRKGTYGAVEVKDGDTVEVVSFMGGGVETSAKFKVQNDGKEQNRKWMTTN